MSVTGYPRNLNPTAPAFLPANLHPIPFFVPIKIYHPLPPPPYPCFFPNFVGAGLPPPASHLPPTSVTPTRALVLLPVPPDVSESSIRRDLEVFGDVRGVQMELADEGIVTVYFYNLRDSQRALTEIRERHMHQEQQVLFNRGYMAARGLVSGRTVWAHFVFPQVTAVPEGKNQGSLVIMNLKPTVSSTTLRHIFQAYGEVKELRDTPFKKEQRFVEFFDVRDAAIALREMNGKSIAGKQIAIQFSRPGGFNRKFYLASRFNKNFLSNHHHHPPQPPPPPPQHYRRRIPSPVKPLNAVGDKQRYEQKQQKSSYRKRWSNHKKKNLSVDDYFTIKENAIATAEPGRDGRTTVMIKNIPNKYTQKQFLNVLDTHCNGCNQKIINEGNNTPMSSYDFLYLPIDFSNKCNVGYGFVNMTTPEAVWRLYKAFHKKQWRVFKSKKICAVTYARVQGIESLKEHFKNARLPGAEMEQYMPVLFSPPRDGRLLSVPISIVVDLGDKPMVDSCHARDDETDISCLSSDKASEEGSDDGCFGERIENGGVSDDESKTVVVVN
ncbi:hypothetical protein EUTSA_v10018362mg [Eutrema salsugineum]|uniref:RRM domain-containing protein n=1 Tax=Eutrema salsugineum TaxID=72664 RepID=V4KMJ6_EUTSA|nr:protein terminal ear1 homolog [Eutrema salsugineum]ESQ28508.1 hypothetical protein EUTSA_v10018362mg [Eutrema salsugineum]